MDRQPPPGERARDHREELDAEPGGMVDRAGARAGALEAELVDPGGGREIVLVALPVGPVDPQERVVDRVAVLVEVAVVDGLSRTAAV
jgi:hypothetical protein